MRSESQQVMDEVAIIWHSSCMLVRRRNDAPERDGSTASYAHNDVAHSHPAQRQCLLVRLIVKGAEFVYPLIFGMRHRRIPHAYCSLEWPL
jgi:hypothetical protein